MIEGDEQRADLLYVSATRRGGLRLAFVEVKFLRYLKTARAADLAERMERQIEASCCRWDHLFGTRTAALEQTVDRAWHARNLRFYARKGCRHGLSDAAFGNAMQEIDRVVRRDLDLPGQLNIKRVGRVSCPEYGGRQPARIAYGGEQDLWLFGPDILPEPRAFSSDDGGMVDSVGGTAPTRVDERTEPDRRNPLATDNSLNGTPTGIELRGRGRFPVGVGHGDNRLLALFGRQMQIRGAHGSDLGADAFIEADAGTVGIDELLVIRMAQACGSAPFPNGSRLQRHS